MRRLGEEIDCALSFALIQVDADPNLWREQLDLSAAAHESAAGCTPRWLPQAVRHAARFPGITPSLTGRPTAGSRRNAVVRNSPSGC